MFSIMTLSMKGLIATLSINVGISNTRKKFLMLSVAIFIVLNVNRHNVDLIISVSQTLIDFLSL